MDTQRGCLEVIFREFPYHTIRLTHLNSSPINTYDDIEPLLFKTYARTTFPQCSLDELDQLYKYLKEHFDNKGTVFTLLSQTASKMLVYNGREPACRYEHVLRWRDLSFQLGQDILTTAYLAGQDVKQGQTTSFFAWRPIIRTNNTIIQQILNQGMAENHFHLNGSTQVFQLNWICLMNHIRGRGKEFKQIKAYLDPKAQYTFQATNVRNEEITDTLHQSVIKAAVYRLYLYLLIKEGMESKEKIQRLICGLEQKEEKEDTDNKEKKTNVLERFIEFLTRLDELDASRIQAIIEQTSYEYGFKEDHITLDYAMDKELMVTNNNTQRILAGERKFLYACYRACFTGRFGDLEQKIFYRYLNISILFRSELIQVNKTVGFANFAKYQDRKEYFIENYAPYERELNRLAIKATLDNQPNLTIEARFAPKPSAAALSKKIGKIDYDVIHEHREGLELLEKTHWNEQLLHNYYYVMHFIKKPDNSQPKDFISRHHKKRKEVHLETKATIHFMEENLKRRERLVGIDAANSEIGCRPEVFASDFRYLRGWLPHQKMGINQQNVRPIRLHGTFHAGEDFLDIADGLRAMDEAILFLNLDRGTRIGHALALGINPEEYYGLKKHVIRMSAQDMLDNAVWLIEKCKEYGICLEAKLSSELQRQFEDLYAEIYRDTITQYVSTYEYYCSWMLRGDEPEVYLMNQKDFRAFIKQEAPILQYDYFRINRNIPNEFRYNNTYTSLYYHYHFDKSVKERGKKIKEFDITCGYINMILKLQEKMREDICKRGIAIECNPSSNYLIGTIERYEHHPIFRFNSRGLKEGWENPLSVSINTDDQGVFDTYLENEYALLALALEKKKNPDGSNRYNSEEIYQWLDYVRRMGIQQRFQND